MKSKNIFKFIVFSGLIIPLLFFSGKGIHGVISSVENRCSKAKGMNSRPNVLLIAIDTLRPDHLGCYGYKRDTSAHIDRFSQEGVIFTQAICQIPEIQSSVISYLTSTFPTLHYRDYQNDRSFLNPKVISLPGIFKKYGYSTGLITDHPKQILRIQGIKSDFDTYWGEVNNNPEELTKFALEWLSKNRNRDFFLYLHYFGSHAPYQPSLPYSRRYFLDKHNSPDKKIPIAKEDKDILGFIPKYVAQEQITSVNYYRCNYDGKIRLVDEQIGTLLSGIKKMGLDKKTLVVLISDHGEALGEHNLYFQHVYTLYDELIKVPLIIKYPGFIPKKRIIGEQVKLLDVMPTILDLAGIKGYHRLEGESLLPVILGKSDYSGKEVFGTACRKIMYSLRIGGWKLMYADFQKLKERQPFFEPWPALMIKKGYPQVYELYNLKKDSEEMRNLTAEKEEKFLFLKKKLDEFVMKSEAQEIAAERQAQQDLTIGEIKPLDHEVIEDLRNLGYVQ